MKDYKNIGLKKFSDRERLQKTLRQTTRKKYKIVISYSPKSATKRRSSFSKSLSSLRLNYSDSLVDTSNMSVEAVLSAVERADLVVLLVDKNFYNGDMAARVAAIVAAVHTGVPLVSVEVESSRALSLSRSSKRTMGKIKNILGHLPQKVRDEFANNSITEEDITFVSKQIGSKMKVSSQQPLIAVENEMTRLS